MTDPAGPTQEPTLESWKVIAQYLNRDARTVRRWEQTEGLPVHRHRHLARNSVYAYPSELDAWRAGRRPEGRAVDASSTPNRLIAIAAALLATLLSAGGGRVYGPVAASQGQLSRQVWANAFGETEGGVSRDGQWISFNDGETGEVGVRNVAATVDVRYSGAAANDKTAGRVYSSRLSPDGSRIVIQWQMGDPQHASIRLIDRSARGLSILYDNPEIGWIAPYDWSPDGREIAVQLRRHVDRTAQIALLSASTGTLRPLKTTTWSGSTALFFSPDGRRLAFDLPVSEGSSNRDIHILHVDGSREQSVVTHSARDEVMGWAPDGKAILFASDRSGRTAVYLMPVRESGAANDQAAGVRADPILIKPDLGRLRLSHGVDRTGRLFYTMQSAARTIEIADVDFQTGKLGAVSRPEETYLWASTQPDWSSRGELVYIQEQPEARSVLTIRDAKGQTRRVSPDVREFAGPTWMPGGAIAVLGRDRQSRGGYFRVDVASGRSTLLHSPEALAGRTYFFSADGNTLYYLRRTPPASVIVARDLRSESERVVTAAGAFALAPDGLSVAFFEHDRTAGTAVLKVMSVADNSAHVVHTFTKGHRLLGMLRWTPDGQRLVYGRWIEERPLPTAFSVAVKGGVPVELDARIPGHPSLSIHPAAGRVAYETGDTVFEIWVLENFAQR